MSSIVTSIFLQLKTFHDNSFENELKSDYFLYQMYCHVVSGVDRTDNDKKAASFDKLAVVSLAATKWYIYLWIHMELFICLYVLLMYVHFLEIKYQSINQVAAFINMNYN